MAESEPKKVDPFKCIVDVREGCAWTIINIPFGVFTHESNMGEPHIATAIGDSVVDLNRFVDYYTSFSFETQCFKQPVLNGFMEMGRPVWQETRRVLQEQLTDSGSVLSQHQKDVMFPLRECTMVMPANIGDYTDFYSSIWHATNVGKLFRSEQEALKPNWLHLPVGYHGRASSVVVSGTNIHRPMGQKNAQGCHQPCVGPLRAA